MEKLLLIGGGGHCKSVIDVIEQQRKYEIAGIVDKKEFVGTTVLGYEVIAHDEQLPSLVHKYPNALVTVGHVQSNALRIKLFATLKQIGYKLPVIVSPLAYVSQHAKIEEGSVVMHHALLNVSARVGKNCIINTKALVEHDATVGDHSHIATAAVVNGGVNVQDSSFIGSNVTTKEYISTEGFVKAGSVIK